MNDPVRSTADEVWGLFENAFRQVKRSDRKVRPEDSIVDDLDLDSLDMIDILSIVEMKTEVMLTEEVAANFGQISKVGELVALVRSMLERPADPTDN